jgi:hypothetical protein
MDASSNALRIVHSVDEDAAVVLELWNASTKPIEVYRIATCAPNIGSLSGAGIQTGSKYSVLPGSTAKQWISKRSRPSCDPLTPRVAAVVFDDGSALGVPSVIRRIKLEYIGRIAETARILRFAEAAGDNPSIESLLGQIGPGPSGSQEEIRAVYQAVIPAEDAAAITIGTIDDESALVGGISMARGTLRSRLERLSALPGRSAEWSRFLDELHEQASAARQYRERVGRDLYP